MTQGLPERRPAARLDPVVYATASHVTHIVACTADRAPLLTHPGHPGIVADEIRAAATRWESVLYCYCIMPDHVHAVLTPGRAGSGDLRRIIGAWKAAVTRALKAEGTEGRIWQRGFWDHVLRREEGVRAVCEYIVANPVRKGLVARWEDWPFSWINPDA